VLVFNVLKVKKPRKGITQKAAITRFTSFMYFQNNKKRNKIQANTKKSGCTMERVSQKYNREAFDC
jgi:hypothetical protein